MPHKDPVEAAAYARAYRAKHKDRINAQRRPKRHGIYLKNREQELEYAKQRRLANGDALRKIEAVRRNANRDTRNSQAREWYKRNQERQRALKRARYVNTREKYIAYQRAYIEANYDSKMRPKALERYKRYRKAHPDKTVIHAMQRRARKTGAIKDGTADAYILSIRAMESVKCNYCPMIMNGRDVHIDHIVALSRGGSHTADNLCPSCPRCNLSKHNRLFGEWTPKAESTT